MLMLHLFLGELSDGEDDFSWRFDSIRCWGFNGQHAVSSQGRVQGQGVNLLGQSVLSAELAGNLPARRLLHMLGLHGQLVVDGLHIDLLRLEVLAVKPQGKPLVALGVTHDRPLRLDDAGAEVVEVESLEREHVLPHPLQLLVEVVPAGASSHVLENIVENLFLLLKEAPVFSAHWYQTFHVCWLREYLDYLMVKYTLLLFLL